MPRDALERYGYTAPYKGDISNYNKYLHDLMRDIGFSEEIRLEELRGGSLVVEIVPKWKAISSHAGRSTAITVNVMRGHNFNSIRRCSGHKDTRTFEVYIREE